MLCKVTTVALVDRARQPRDGEQDTCRAGEHTVARANDEVAGRAGARAHVETSLFKQGVQRTCARTSLSSRYMCTHQLAAGQRSTAAGRWRWRTILVEHYRLPHATRAISRER